MPESPMFKAFFTADPNSRCLGISVAPVFLSPDKRMSWINRRSTDKPKRQQLINDLLSLYNIKAGSESKVGRLSPP